MAVTIEEALEIIYTNIKAKSTQLLPIENALGYILAEDIIATHNLPPYDNSAMDGYAVKVEDSGKCVDVKCTIFAGDDFHGEVKTGSAIKIMTGAKIPLKTQTIVPIEDVKECDGGVILPQNLVMSNHIRLSGEDIKKECELLHHGDKLNAYQITLLASQGISHVKVYKKPKVAVFASGNELKMHFEKVEKYQLYNTNTPMILARAKELGCEVEFIGTSVDTIENLHKHIESALDCDIIITSGGVSVGDADYTKEAFEKFGHKIFFDKIEIKPGKPTTFGKIQDKAILNLPGNPMAAALNFELFAKAIIYAMSGAKQRFIKPISAKMKNDYKLKKGRRTLVPGYFDGEFFEAQTNFAPGMISPLAKSNSFIVVSENLGFIERDSIVKVISYEFEFKTSKHTDITTV